MADWDTSPDLSLWNIPEYLKLSKKHPNCTLVLLSMGSAHMRVTTGQNAGCQMVDWEKQKTASCSQSSLKEEGREKVWQDSWTALPGRAGSSTWPATRPSHHRKQRSGNGREATVDFYQPRLQNRGWDAAPNSHPRGPLPPYPPRPNTMDPQGNLSKHTKTVANTNRDLDSGYRVWLNIRKKRHY